MLVKVAPGASELLADDSSWQDPSMQRVEAALLTSPLVIIIINA